MAEAAYQNHGLVVEKVFHWTAIQFGRLRQENFFKYMRQEFLIDALSDYEVEPDDPQRSVPNPARKAVDKELGKARARLNKLKHLGGHPKAASQGHLKTGQL